MTGDLRERVAAAVDTSTTGRYDVTPLLADAALLRAVADEFAAAAPFDLVAGVDALGFALGGAVAARAGTGLAAVRKGGKLPLPDDALRRREFADYSGARKALALRPDAVLDGARVLVVDDWIETGAQARAAADLVAAAGGTVAAVAVVAAERTERTAGLRAEHDVHALCDPADL